MARASRAGLPAHGRRALRGGLRRPCSRVDAGQSTGRRDQLGVEPGGRAQAHRLELGPCYHRYTVEISMHFLILAARNGLAVAPGLAQRVGRMLDFLLAVRRPDGSMPQIGDADGGWLLPLVRRAPDDLRGIFATAAAFFGRPDCAWAGGPAPEPVWLLGPAGMQALDALAPAPPAMPASRLFGKAG